MKALRKREASGVVRLARPVEAAAAAPAALALAALRVTAFEDGVATLELGQGTARATLDASVHPAVIATALARGERVLAQQEAGGWVILGALRTSPTPGVDKADEFLIEAGRVRFKVSDELTVAAGTSSFAVRAYGMIETLADQITTRASSVHKIIGRMLHLN